MNNRPSWLDWFYIVILVVIWGSAFLFIKLALDNFPPTTLVFIRLALGATVMLMVLAIKTGYLQSISPKLWLFFLCMALLGNALPFTAISWGQQFVSSGIAGLMMAIVPLSTLFLAHFFIPGETITPRKLTGFCGGFIGVFVLMAPELEFNSDNTQLWGMLAFLIAGLAYSASNIMAKLRPPSNDLFTTTAVLCLSSLMMLPLSLGTGEPWLSTPLQPAAVISIAILGLVCTALATYLYYRVLRSAGPAFVSQMNYFIPIWALLIGVIFLDETIGLNAIVALVLILSGIFIAHSGQQTNEEVDEH